MKSHIPFITIALLISCTQISEDESKSVETSDAQLYEPTFESLANYKIPDWYTDAKFGIFIHWGAYAVPAYGSEWYPRNMYMDTATFSAILEPQDEGPNPVYTHHIENWGSQKEFGYKDFIPLFKAENFNAEEWINVFKKSGAKYVVPVAEHHDGFAMYDSKVTRWNAVNMGPKRDILGELFEVGKEAGLIMGASTHFAFNWSFFNKKDHFDTVDPEYSDFYSKKGKNLNEPVSAEFLELWWNRTTDIIDNYQPDILWFDFYWDQEAFAPYHPKMASYFYNNGLKRGKDVVLQNKNHLFPSFPEGTIVYDLERGKMKGIRKHTWQTDTSIGRNSWGYIKNWESKDANTIIDDLIDIVSKNGTMLLNIGPKADGTIPADQQEILFQIGEWLDVNGAAIFGSRCWTTFGEGPTESEEGYMSERKKQDSFVAEDYRFTTNNDKLYAIAMDWPENGTAIIQSLGQDSEYEPGEIKNVSLLGHEGAIEWSQKNNGLEIQFPDNPSGEYAHTFEIEFE